MIFALLAACDSPDLLSDSGESGEPPDSDGATDTAACDATFTPAAVPVSATCVYAISSSTPAVEWDILGGSSLALPAVADLDGDGIPEIVVNLTDTYGGNGTLAAYHGDGSGLLWEAEDASLGSGDAPAVADLDDDGSPEVVCVRRHDAREYTVGAWSSAGVLLWESAHYTGAELDYASAPVISDMDHDGSPEIVIGRVILHSDGSERAVGAGGRGASVPLEGLSEGAHPAVADLDLDGVEEVITGNTRYDPDGNILWMDAAEDDGAVAVANLDADAEGELVVVRWNEVSAYDTDGTLLWGPLTISTANILPVPAIGDLDGDGDVEIVVGGGREFWALDGDGARIWTAVVSDQSGASGPSLFDFDADGTSEVVYIDEAQLVVFDGVTGRQVMQTDEHTSVTMYDYPVIADVDADGHAEIVVAHHGFTSALSVFGDSAGAWAPARSVWNQHAYSVTNIDDDLGVPVTAVPNFTLGNSWHSASGGVAYALGAEILDICEEECAAGRVSVWARLNNRGDAARDAGIGLDLYCVTADENILLASGTTSTATGAGMTSDALLFEVSATDLAGCTALEVVPIDPVGGASCPEDLAAATRTGPFCP